MDQHSLFIEDINHAMKDLVAKVGGAKTVAALLWPDRDCVDMAKYLNNCLDPARNEKLSLEQIMFLLKKGRQVDCHVAIHFICADAGYAEPQTRDPVDEFAELQREYIASVRRQEEINKRMERFFGQGATLAAVST